jgi:tRNA A37 N6-isopentenylltransferase MiaA
MEIETLRDVLEWTQQVHQHLSACLHHCSSENQQQRAVLLLNYLSDHEKRLSKLLKKTEETADPKALKTWCYEYFEKNPVVTHKHCEKPFADMNPEEIINEVMSLHEQVIDVYRQLNDQFETPSATRLIEALLQLEQHEAMRIAHGSNRLQDI